jgi:hypothetical protein
MGPWDEGLPLRRLEGAAWIDEHHDPMWPVLSSLPSDDDGSEGARVLHSIPADVREMVRPFAEYQWTALHVLRVSPSGRELCATAPNLVWLALESWRRREVPVDELSPARLERLFRLPRADLFAGFVGFRPAPRQLHFVQRFQAAQRSPLALRILLDGAAHDGVVRFFAHEPRATPSAVAVALKHPLLLELPAFRDATRRGDDAVRECSLLAPDTVRMLGGNRPERVRAARDMPALVRLHDELVEQHIQWFRGGGLGGPAPPVDMDAPFPEPPFPSTETIVALRNGRELIEEAEKMRHCVATYARECLEGRSSIYRVLAPGRATLQLVPGAGGWRAAQLKGARNAATSTETHEAVARWLIDSARRKT